MASLVLVDIEVGAPEIVRDELRRDCLVRLLEVGEVLLFVAPLFEFADPTFPEDV